MKEINVKKLGGNEYHIFDSNSKFGVKKLMSIYAQDNVGCEIHSNQRTSVERIGESEDLKLEILNKTSKNCFRKQTSK